MSREFHGVAVYNPDLLAKHELVRLFVARRPLLERLIRDLHDETVGLPQHHVVIGRPGMGKTTLLQRLRYAIEDDPTLDARWLPLSFPEEQHNVASLSDFWLNCVDALADSLESRGQHDGLLPIDEQLVDIAAIASEDTRRSSALKLLRSVAERVDRRLILLIDNLDLVFERLDQDDWALREVLSREPWLLIIGATSQPLESSFRYDKAFYDFFRAHNLDGLDEPQAFELMRHLAVVTEQPRVLEIIDREPGRVQTLRLLSGGDPRTLVLLFNLLCQATEGDPRSDLERLLDQITPLYKHRLAELPAQAQRVVDALALHWDPATARELADRLRLDVNQVSAQLNRLVKHGVVEKTRLPGNKRAGFQLSERFFNIWYLMRASRRSRQRLLALVEFLALLFPSEAPGDAQDPAAAAPARRQAARGEWPTPVALQFLSSSDAHDRQTCWADIASVFTDLVRHGHASRAHAFLQTLANAETWAPMIAALEAADHGSADSLLALSPELRHVAELTLARIAPQLSHS